MNPKNISDLDPKLRQAYEKVMGTTFSPQTSQAPQNSQPPTQPYTQEPNSPNTQQPNTPLMQTQPADEPTPAIQSIPTQPPAPANPTPSPLPTQNPFVQTPEPPPTVFTQPAQQQGRAHAFMPIVFLIGGSIFFAAYAVIWAKVFGLF